MTKNDSSQLKANTSSIATVLKIAGWSGFAIVALLTAVLTFMAVRDFVATWKLTNLPGVTVQDATPTPNASGEAPVANVAPPLEPAAGPTPPPWDGAGRVSVLVMGLDYRDWQAGEGPPRSDTMILLTIDPVNLTAGMLSIPRDLWVNIPNSGYGRINTAYQMGEALKLPGGGPALAADTVEELLGVPIDYYAQIDFAAFVRFIDEIGGVTVKITEPIKVDPMNGVTKTLRPGTQVLPGDLALAYVRVRKTEGGDFDRGQRQQDVVMSIRDKILSMDTLPTLISKAPVLYEELSSGINTNLSLDQVIRLAWAASQVPKDRIKQGAIGAAHVSFATSPDGQQEVLKPITEKIRELRDEVFSDTGPTSPIAATTDLTELMKTEGARVSVLNGSYTAGLASQTADYLKSLGVNVTETGNSDQYASYTTVTFYTGKPYTVKFLVELMKISDLRIRHIFDLTKSVDILIVVGDDWANSNTMP